MKRALITGGTRGIGLACVKLFLEKGYDVTATYAKNEKDAENASATFPGAKFVKVDVSDEEAVKTLFESMKTVDVVVNNAGVSSFGLVQDVTAEEWRRVFSVNMDGTFYCTKYAVKKMVSEGRGAIVNVSSVWGQTGASCESVYSATKGGIIAFTKAVAKEVAPSGITVNCVAPGVIDTEMNEKFSEEEISALCEEIPVGRMGSVDEVASAIYFLTENKYVTGEIISVNGGFFI